MFENKLLNFRLLLQVQKWEHQVLIKRTPKPTSRLCLNKLFITIFDFPTFSFGSAPVSVVAFRAVTRFGWMTALGHVALECHLIIPHGPLRKLTHTRPSTLRIRITTSKITITEVRSCWLTIVDIILDIVGDFLLLLGAGCFLEDWDCFLLVLVILLYNTDHCSFLTKNLILNRNLPPSPLTLLGINLILCSQFEK